MNCPKCGKELIIGSTLCPDCDVLPEPKKNKPRKLSNQGKLIIAGFVAVLLVIFTIVLCVVMSGYKVEGIENGNSVNLSYAQKIGKSIYYSDGSQIYSIDKKFKKTEVIDSGKDIYCLNEFDGNLYYIKDNVLCKYSPKKRVISEIMGFPDGKKANVIGKSNEKIYFGIEGEVYCFEAETSKMQLIYKGDAVISDNVIYLFSEGSVQKINLSNGKKKVLCEAGQFEKPSFVVGNNIYVVDYKDMNIFTVNKKNGERKLVFKSSEHPKISDVSKVNYYSGDLLFTSKDGIYKIDVKTGKEKLLDETGYVNSICVVDKKIFCRQFDGELYFLNMSGKVLFKQ